MDKYFDIDEKYKNIGWWWLRTIGGVPDSATYVYYSRSDFNYNDNVRKYGVAVNSDDGGVRPALWIDLDS